MTPPPSAALLFPALLVALSGPLLAGPRTSASYALRTDSTDIAGRRATSATYTHDGSLGGLTGTSNVVAPTVTAKAGYLAQLYDVTGLNVTAASSSIGESTTLQLAAAQVLDDLTLLAVPAANVAWSVQSGPLAGIGAGGLASAGAVYQNESATAKGVFAGQTGTLGLTVLNTLPDNFGSYAADGIADDWQVQYFGVGNPAAAPLLDPDGDGQNNLFEFTAGIVPTNPASVFTLRIEAVVGQPSQRNLVFSPRLAGRTYTVRSTLSLTPATWAALTSSTTQDSGAQRTVTDTAATEALKFYRVEIVRP
ncbi:MAG: hypothetical protein H7067_10485 [Burkholderiales bacterium]|nr:hypothetical protein [Opitutaceae bacterium]